MRVRLPDFAQRMQENLTPGEKRQLQPIPANPLPGPAPAPVPVPAPAPAFPQPEPGVPAIPVPPTVTRTRTIIDDDGPSSSVSSRVSSTSRAASSSSSSSSSSITITSSSSPSSPTSTSSFSTTIAVTPSTTATSLIFVNTFPTDFPVETRVAQEAWTGGRGYVMIKSNQAADSMLLFTTFFLALLLLTIACLRVMRHRDNARGREGKKEDQMVSEEMKWQERRLVVERKIIREARGTAGVPMGGGLGGSKLRKEL